MTDADEREEAEESEDDGAEPDYEDDGEGAPLPWKKIGIAAAIVGVLAGGYYGIGYLRLDGKLDEAERLIAAKQHTEAIAVLDQALATSPDSGRGLLLKMKAEFLRGNWQAAGALAQQNDGKTVKGELAAEVNTIAARAQAALRAAGQARELFGRGEAEKAELLLSEAAGLYPESAEIRDSFDSVSGTVAFQKKEYARFLKIAEESVERRPESPAALALLASALSAQYAATGEATYRERGEKALERAASISTKDPMAKALYEEYSPRIRHRLETREIIDRAEYDRRFRGAKSAPRG